MPTKLIFTSLCSVVFFAANAYAADITASEYKAQSLVDIYQQTGTEEDALRYKGIHLMDKGNS